MIKIRSMLNFLVITIMVSITALTAIFINLSIHMKGKMTFRAVQQTELISELLTHSVSDLMKDGHQSGEYASIQAYGNIIGVDDIGVFRLDGSEGFTEKGSKPRTLPQTDINLFRKAVSSTNVSANFDWNDMTYTRFVPLKAEAECTRCHTAEGSTLGVLKIRLSTSSDLQLLNYVQRLIWTLGFIVFLPLGGLLIAYSFIREKNKIHRELRESNENLTNTYNELDKTKHYLQMIMDNSKVIIVTADTDGKIVKINREAQALLEYTNEEAAGKDVLMLYENPHQRIEMLKESKGGVWAVKNREVALRSKSGKILHVSLTLSTMVNEKGEVMGTVGVGKDISEQKMLQFKLLQSEKLAGIGTLASGIAHEINNPLAGILGMAEAIRDEADIELIKAYTNDIIQYAVNASNIVKELSSYSRSTISAGSSTIDLSLSVENSLKMARHSASFMSVVVVTDLEKDCLVIANSGEMQQVFVNLIVNAMHAMGDRGTLTIKCMRDGNFIKSTISDTGHGIAEKDLTQIFDPFFTTKPPGMGTGLGLYVIYKIVMKYRGMIDVDSKVGVGTTFTLRFPSAEFQSEAKEVVA